jgi:hypothetical protein
MKAENGHIALTNGYVQSDANPLNGILDLVQALCGSVGATQIPVFFFLVRFSLLLDLGDLFLHQLLNVFGCELKTVQRPCGVYHVHRSHSLVASVALRSMVAASARALLSRVQTSFGNAAKDGWLQIGLALNGQSNILEKAASSLVDRVRLQLRLGSVVSAINNAINNGTARIQNEPFSKMSGSCRSSKKKKKKRREIKQSSYFCKKTWNIGIENVIGVVIESQNSLHVGQVLKPINLVTS